MSIIAYTGLPGHGKSYGVVDNVIKPALKAKRDVFTNIPLNDDVCLDRFGCTAEQFDIQDIIDNSDWFDKVFRAGAIIIIDELWRLWPAGIKANMVRSEDKAFLAEHRHMVGENGQSTEIIFVTQDLSQIATFARSLIETTFLVKKLASVGMSKSFRVDVFFGAVTGVNPPKSKREKEIFGKFTKETFELYKSHTKSKTGLAGDETRTDKRFNVLSGYKIKLFFGALIVFGTGAYLGLSSLFENGLNGSAQAATDSDPKTERVMVRSENGNYSLQDIDQIKRDAAMAAESRIKKQQQNQFLYDSDHIEISLNMGIFPDVKYLFNVVFSDGVIEVDESTLSTLGYSVEPLNSCLVKIKSDHYVTYAKCYQERENSNFFHKLAS